MTRLAILLVILTLFAISDAALKEKKDLSQDPYFEDLMLEKCPVKKMDGSVCATKEYEMALKSNGLRKLRESHEKHHHHIHHLRKKTKAARKYHLAKTFCCLEKQCLLGCRKSIFLEGFPDNELLIKSLDPEYYEKKVKSLGKKLLKGVVSSMDVMILQKSEYFEQVLNETFYFLSAEQRQMAVLDTKNRTKTPFAEQFPDNFGFLLNLDSVIFNTMSYADQKAILCNNARGYEEIDLIQWRVVIGVLDEHFVRLTRKMILYGVLKDTGALCYPELGERWFMKFD